MTNFNFKNMQKGRKSDYSSFAFVDRLIDVTFKTIVLHGDHWVRDYPYIAQLTGSPSSKYERKLRNG